MAIDLSGLPLALDGAVDPAALRRRAGARLAATEAWLDQDDETVNRIAADHRDLAPDIDPLRKDLALRRDMAADSTRHEDVRAAIGATLGRLAIGAAESDEPARRDSHGALARLALQEHAEAGLIDPGEAEAFAGGYDARLAAADAEKLARTDPVLARLLLADRSMFPGLLPGQRERLGRAAEARLAAAPDDEAASAERTAAIGVGSTLTVAARNRADLRRRLTAGEAGLADIDAAEAAGEIDARGAGALRQGFTAAREKARQEAEGIRRVEARLVAGGRLDPASAEDRTALDAHYLNTRKGWDEAGLAPEEVRAELADYILDTGCFPDAVRQRIGRIFRVGTPQERWGAVDLIRTMEERSRELLDQLDPDDVREALAIAALEKAGWPAAEAVARYGLLASGEAKDPATARDRAAVERAQGDAQGIAPITHSIAEQEKSAGAKSSGVRNPSHITLPPSLATTTPLPGNGEGPVPAPGAVLARESVGAQEDIGGATAPDAESSAALAEPQSNSPSVDTDKGEAESPAVTFDEARSAFERMKLELPKSERDLLAGAWRIVDDALADATPEERSQLERYLNGDTARLAAAPAIGYIVWASVLLIGAALSNQPQIGRLFRSTPSNTDAELEKPVRAERGASGSADPAKASTSSSQEAGRRSNASDPITKSGGLIGHLIFDIAEKVAREDKRGNKATTEANRRFAELCSEYAAKSYPGLSIKHVAGAIKDGTGHYLKEKNIEVVRDDGVESFRRGDLLYQAIIDGVTYSVLTNSVTTRKSGRLISKERRALEDLAKVALLTVAYFAKRRPDEDDEDFDDRALAACKKGLEGAFGPPVQ